MKSFVARFFLSLLVVATFPLFGQTPPDDPPVPDNPPSEMQPPRVEEVVVVTARKKEETVQDVPMSVAAPTEAQLRDLGAENIEDVAANVAGFTVQNLGPGQSQIAIRGVSAGQIVRDQPGVKEQVGVYLDESVISLSLFTPDLDLFDMNRIEVLRGPQGTLFGSGSLSGTVRYISNQPTLRLSESVGELSVSTVADGSIGGSAKAAINVPIGEYAAMRVVAYYTRYGGFIDAIQPSLQVNEDVNDGDRIGARLTFLYQPYEGFSVTPRLLFQKVEMNGWNRVDDFNILANPFTTTRPAVNLGEREQFTQFEEPFSDEFLLGDLNVAYDFGPVTLTSITSYTDRDVLVVRDATALTASITGGSVGQPESVFTIDAPLDDATTAKSLTQEVRLSGGRPGLEWVTGVFYSNTDRDYGQSLFVNGFEDATGFATRGNFGAAKDVLYFSDLTYEFDQLAVFGEGTWSVTPRLDLTGGLRWYDFEEKRVQTFDGFFADPGTTRGTVDATGIAPRVMASFKVSDQTRLNAQVSKGFRLGGINDPLNLPLCSDVDIVTFGGRDTWEDEELWNYEVGAKLLLGGTRGSFNAALFRSDIKNLQATVTAGSCSSRVVFNVPDSRAQGLEVELEYELTDSLDFAISASRIETELLSTLTSTDDFGNVSIVAGIEQGNRFPTVPEFQVAAAASYRWTMSQGMAGYLTTSFQHLGRRYTQIGDQGAGFGSVNLRAFDPNNIGGPYTQNTFTFDPELPSSNTVNVRVGVLRNTWDTALFVNNITDERALLALDQERGTLARVGYLTNQPRTIGVSTRFVF
ncbi:MAG TPA: TonB-dependent receptor [Thermoanaerobaculia bacterium]|nr:TonB-dependent receptor [Thermoanaerobaculia bacterium]